MENLGDIKIEVNVTSRNINKIKEENPDLQIELNSKVLLPFNKINKNSKIKIDFICNICKSVNNISIEKYYKNINRSKDNIYTCKSCSNIKRKNTMLELYDVENSMKKKEFLDKAKSTMLKKYGAENSWQSDEIRNKFNNTMLEKYGSTNTLTSDILKDKIKKTINLKYNVEHYSKSLNFKDKLRNKWINELKKYFINEGENILNIDNNNLLAKLICNKNHEYEISRKLYYQRKYLYKVEICTECNKKFTYSNLQNLILNYIKENYNLNILCNDRTILNGLELDIYLPDINIAFEINGLFWHTENFKTNDYHLNKTLLCENKNIKLIHLWEDDILNRFDAIKNIINTNLKINNKIYARKCIINNVDKNIAINFFEKYHIQGGNSLKFNECINIGLYYNNELLSIMTFCKNRKFLQNNNYEWELLRFATKLNFNIIGGASKLLNYFINTYKGNIISYCDRSRSNGNVYKLLNFKLKHITKPGYYYFNTSNKEIKKINRFSLRKDVLIKMGAIGKNEHDMANSLSYFRIYDCGQYVFEYLN